MSNYDEAQLQIKLGLASSEEEHLLSEWEDVGSAAAKNKSFSHSRQDFSHNA